MGLAGVQLSLLVEVVPYLIVNPPELKWITTRSGTATVTRIERVGSELVVWADYGSGIEQPHGDEDAAPVKLVLMRQEAQSVSEAIPETVPETVPEADPLAPKSQTQACGWIGWKETKRERKRRDPWICRQAWLYWEEAGGKKRSRYIPKAKLAAVQESVYELRRSVYETLELLEKNPSKL